MSPYPQEFCLQTLRMLLTLHLPSILQPQPKEIQQAKKNHHTSQAKSEKSAELSSIAMPGSPRSHKLPGRTSKPGHCIIQFQFQNLKAHPVSNPISLSLVSTSVVVLVWAVVLMPATDHFFRDCAALVVERKQWKTASIGTSCRLSICMFVHCYAAMPWLNVLSFLKIRGLFQELWLRSILALVQLAPSPTEVFNSLSRLCRVCPRPRNILPTRSFKSTPSTQELMLTCWHHDKLFIQSPDTPRS